MLNTLRFLACEKQNQTGPKGLIARIPGLRETTSRVHGGFWRAYSTIREQLYEATVSALADAGPKARLYCTGHSLGGALATLAAYDLLQKVADNKLLQGRIRIGPGGAEDRDPRNEVSVRVATPPAAARAVSFESSSSEEEEVQTKPSRRGMRFSDLQRSSKPKDTGTGAGAGAGAKETNEVLPGAESKDSSDLPPTHEADPRVGVLPAVMENGDGSKTHRLDVVSALPICRPHCFLSLRQIHYTFGSPRVGNHAFARAFNKVIPYSFRVVFDGDIIAGIPKFIRMFKHVGVEVRQHAT